MAQPLAVEGAIQSLDRPLGARREGLLLAEDQHLALDAHPVVDVARVAVEPGDGGVGRHHDPLGVRVPVEDLTGPLEALDPGLVVDAS